LTQPAGFGKMQAVLMIQQNTFLPSSADKLKSFGYSERT
jgi:hypothetical protein